MAFVEHHSQSPDPRHFIGGKIGGTLRSYWIRVVHPRQDTIPQRTKDKTREQFVPSDLTDAGLALIRQLDAKGVAASKDVCCVQLGREAP